MKNIHQTITNDIVEAMKTAKDFEMPWHTQCYLPTNESTKKTYNGINILSLWTASLKNQYTSNQWATYKQWQALGAQVNKGEKSSRILIYKPINKEESEPTSPGEQNNPLLIIRSANVFNIEQVSGYEQQEYQEKIGDKTKQLINVDEFIANTQATIKTGGDRAFYHPKLDEIAMPDKALFFATKSSTVTEAYYSTLLHELSHWAGHKSRCDRVLGTRFGSEAYAMEELIAELGSAFLCAELKVTPSPRQDHADYLQHWIDVMEQDPKAILLAASKASQAVTYLKSLQVLDSRVLSVEY